MRFSIPFVSVVTMGALLLAGCGETSHSNGHGGTGGEAPEVVTLFGRTYEFNPAPLVQPLEGVRVCELGTDRCVLSNARGLVFLDFRRTYEETAITMEKEGYGSWVYPNVTDEAFHEGGSQGGPAQFPMFTHEQLAVVAEQVQASYPWKGGMVALVRWQSPNPGGEFIPVGSTVDAVGDAFYWDAATQRYSFDIGSTTYAWNLTEYPLGEGGFAEVTPGVHQFELGGTAGDCNHASWAWPGDAPNRIRIPVLEGFTTYGSMRCDDPPD